MPPFRINPIKVPAISSSVTGMGTKLTGRVDISRMSIAQKPIVKAPVMKKTAAKKEVEKTASLGTNMAQHMGMTVAGVLGAAAAAGAINKAYKAVEHVVNMPAMNSSFEKAIKINPKLQAYPREVLKSYFDLIAEASPTVAKNPLLVANYMQYLIDHQGGINFMSYRQLADLEGQLLSNERDAAPMTQALQKGLVDGAIKGMTDEVIRGRQDSSFVGRLNQLGTAAKTINDASSAMKNISGLRAPNPTAPDYEQQAYAQSIGRLKAETEFKKGLV